MVWCLSEPWKSQHLQYFALAVHAPCNFVHHLAWLSFVPFYKWRVWSGIRQEFALTANDFGMKLFHQIIREGRAHPDVLWHLNKKGSKGGGMMDWMTHRQNIRQERERKWQSDSNKECVRKKQKPGVLIPCCLYCLIIQCLRRNSFDSYSYKGTVWNRLRK